MDVHFERMGCVANGLGTYVPMRLWFDENGDLCREPEVYDEVVRGK
jgi:hypothetical protein